MAADIVDRIYEAAALPELWADVYHELSLAHGFVGAGMFTLNERFQRGVASPAIRELLDAFIAGGWAARNPRAPRVAARGLVGFVRDQDILTDEEIATDPMYVELLRPHGVGWGAGAVVNCPNGDAMVFSFERALELGPTELSTLSRLNELQPHLARAAAFSARIDLEKARARVSALAQVGLPAAVLSLSGRALAMNEEFEALTAQVTIGAHDAMALRDPRADRQLRAAIERGPGGVGRSIALPGADEAPPAVLHVLPIRRAARDVFSRADWLLAAQPLGMRGAPDATLLGGLFDLTPAESRVVRGLLEGKTLADIATGLGLSPTTVRNQLGSIFAKTGVSRQAELVLLCGSFASCRGQ
ncbi:helix-turn-helix transcriptional regulator [Hansschlegelia sp. KR7-227]|uniref:helix-turn-helix transcriptional regulator n=1 Tax=Hansschlegelia sp. KR7-227 TaxID=3400914 RepID=UPI003C09CBA7